MDPILKDLPLRFDHAALQSEVDESAVRRLCDDAREYGFFSVAVNPAWTALAAGLLVDSNVKVLSVAGFPLGATRTDVKVVEAVEGVNDGAQEIDMVANIGWLCSDRFDEAEVEIRKVRRNLPPEVILKVIIEAGKLSERQQREATKCVINGGAQFVKTCTGFFGGATVEQVRTLHAAAAGKVEVKASGGIRTFEQCRELLEAGATRLGSSSSVAIVGKWLSGR